MPAPELEETGLRTFKVTMLPFGMDGYSKDYTVKAHHFAVNPAGGVTFSQNGVRGGLFDVAAFSSYLSVREVLDADSEE